MNKKLINAVAKQAGGVRNLKESVSDVVNHGAAGGYTGFIYYEDTVAFTKKNLVLIMQHLNDCADDLGFNALDLLSNFNCFKNMSNYEIFDGLMNPDSADRQTVYNGLAWFALEEVASHIAEE